MHFIQIKGFQATLTTNLNHNYWQIHPNSELCGDYCKYFGELKTKNPFFCHSLRVKMGQIFSKLRHQLH